MDVLRRQCPWDRAQTHASLAPYLLEETYETLAALDDGDAAAIADELGDVLLQVFFHSRVASERTDGFTIDDVAAGLVRKLRRRHPHVFPDADGRLAEADTAGAVQVRWEQIKQAERSAGHEQAAGIADGIPASLPALARAQKVLRRLDRRGLAVSPLGPSAGSSEAGTDEHREQSLAVGARLLEAVRAAEAAGVDAEGALRQATAAVERAVDAP
jgi:XTP/dITP diphosphohydrolase